MIVKRGFLNTNKGKATISLKSEDHYPSIEKQMSKLALGGTPIALDQPADVVAPSVVADGKKKASSKRPSQRSARTRKGADGSDIRLTITQVPNYGPTAKRADHPAGWTACLLTPAAEKTIISQPGFPRSPPQPTSLCYELSESNGKGHGLFATRKIKAGELIISERPITVTPAEICEAGFRCPAAFTPQQRRQAMMSEWENVMKTLCDRLDPEDRDAYRALHNCNQRHRTSRALTGINQTNSFVVDALTEQIETGDKRKGLYKFKAVSKTLSRINHSCSPNTTRDFDLASFSFQLRACRDILPSEELTINYCPLTVPAEKRQDILKPYEFRCTCPRCSNAELSDLNLNRILSFASINIQSLFASNQSEKIIQRCPEELEVLEQEGLQCTQEYEKALQMSMVAHQMKANVKAAVEFGEKIGQWWIATKGDDTPLRRWRDPKEHEKMPWWRVLVCQQDTRVTTFGERYLTHDLNSIRCG